MSSSKSNSELRKLDLPNQFGNHADDLLNAIKKGRTAHSSGNIKASGAPLEAQFREILGASLPSTSKVAAGYFYDAASNCSPEVDVIVYDDAEAFRLDPAPQDQHYVPYTSVSILGQVKNSASSLFNALEQIQGSIDAWAQMRARVPPHVISSGIPYQFEPLTFVLCGTSTDKDISSLSETLQRAGSPYPDYILFLDRGLIVAGRHAMIEFDDPYINFFQYRTVNTYDLCRVDGDEENAKGLALMWIYFSLVNKLSLDKGNNLRYQMFCRQIEQLYKLRPFQTLI